MKKITKTTFKKFIRDNDHILIKNHSRFDGMTDGIETLNGDFRAVLATEKFTENTLGIDGLWLVGGGRDYFSEFIADGMIGITVSNCCGSQTLAIKI